MEGVEHVIGKQAGEELGDGGHLLHLNAAGGNLVLEAGAGLQNRGDAHTQRTGDDGGAHVEGQDLQPDPAQGFRAVHAADALDQHAHDNGHQEHFHQVQPDVANKSNVGGRFSHDDAKQRA